MLYVYVRRSAKQRYNPLNKILRNNEKLKNSTSYVKCVFLVNMQFGGPIFTNSCQFCRKITNYKSNLKHFNSFCGCLEEMYNFFVNFSRNQLALILNFKLLSRGEISTRQFENGLKILLQVWTIILCNNLNLNKCGL